ncbi:unnamed protein product [Allacma fusca]|uniref:Zinc transporter ZIP14 n=1 Tax=Allacma fusca TaxID=39272 RepID=A0A8J2L502_9HEXA|nr:unnamed protein product [Allacma fusca]
MADFHDTELHTTLGNSTMDDRAVPLRVPMTSTEIWGYGFLFVTLINLSSVMGIVFFPLMNKRIYATVMRVMIGLAIGSLSGSALFHLIPKALKLEADSLNTLAFVWISIWVVMILESAMKIGLKTRKTIQDEKNGKLTEFSNLQNNNPCNHSIPILVDNEEMSNGNLFSDPIKTPNVSEDVTDTSLRLNQGQIPIYHSTFSLNKLAVEALRSSERVNGEANGIKTVAWVIIFGDGLHNFIDGVSIGAAFTTDFTTGAVICLAIVCEEFPHELGDFAILINSGLSVKKALLFNFLSALTCYLGLILGIMLGGEFDWSYYIFAVAAGVFLYVALGDMVPEVTEIIEELSELSPSKAWSVLLVHHFGIMVGISILYTLAKYLPE